MPEITYAAIDAAAATRVALAALYQQYVLEQHGAGTCDCDAHMPTCAPCLARDALGIDLAAERAHDARLLAGVMASYRRGNAKAIAAYEAADPDVDADVPQ